MIHVYKEKLIEINKKLITNEFIKVKEPRIATFRLYQIWAIFASVHLLLLLNTSFLYVPFQ